jgi:hypothetical protein
MFSSEPSAPVFIARTSMSASTSTACARTTAPATGCAAASPRVDCTVSTAHAAAPHAPAARNPLRSAAIPAPPHGSRPAIASATSGVRSRATSGNRARATSGNRSRATSGNRARAASGRFVLSSRSRPMLVVG